MERQSGILLHPTSLPGGAGGSFIGDLGDSAYVFVDFLQEAGQRLWQMLPLNYPGYGHSPYSALSAYAGNPWLISIDRLVADGLLSCGDVKREPDTDRARALFDAAVAWKEPLLRRAWSNLAAVSDLHDSFGVFCQQQQYWLDDFAAYMALKKHHGGSAWNEWNMPREGAMPFCYRELREEMNYQKCAQFLFHRQWHELKAYANAHGIAIVGDIPIYVSYDSADVWSHPEQFHLDEAGAPAIMAGVPPDYFSSTGQLWGNPIYRWEDMQKNGYAWWMERIAYLLQLTDWVRIDHFIGFVRYWAVPAGETTAVNGEYREGPAFDFFRTLTERFHNVPVIAEDLGVITPEVTALKDRFGLPGMKVLHFQFYDGTPMDFPDNTALYTGTHDNDTTVGWYEHIRVHEPELLATVNRMVPGPREHVAWDMMEYVSASHARFAVFPMQDVLELGTEARMNVPGYADGNWGWRMLPRVCTPQLAARLREMTERCKR